MLTYRGACHWSRRLYHRVKARHARCVLFPVLVTPRFTYLVSRMCSRHPLPTSENVVHAGHDVGKLRGAKDGKQYTPRRAGIVVDQGSTTPPLRRRARRRQQSAIGDETARGAGVTTAGYVMGITAAAARSQSVATFAARARGGRRTRQSRGAEAQPAAGIAGFAPIRTGV